jgi:Tol biopolymer transport system component
MVLLAGLVFFAAGSALPSSTMVAPLAAALVINGQLALADIPTRSLRAIPLGDLKPEEADLSLDKTQIVLNAWPRQGGRSRLFLVDVATGQVKPLTIALAGDQRFPRFADDGASVVFSASHRDLPDSPVNRTHIEKVHLADGRLEELPGDPQKCEFSVMAMAKGQVAHLSTSCYINFAIQMLDVRHGKNKLVASVRESWAEIAVSTDGRKLVYTDRGPDGVDFFVVDAGKPPRKLVGIPTAAHRMQPRFVCPQNVVLLSDDKVWSLDSVSGALTELMGVREGFEAAKAEGGGGVPLLKEGSIQ